MMIDDVIKVRDKLKKQTKKVEASFGRLNDDDQVECCVVGWYLFINKDLELNIKNNRFTFLGETDTIQSFYRYLGFYSAYEIYVFNDSHTKEEMIDYLDKIIATKEQENNNVSTE